MKITPVTNYINLKSNTKKAALFLMLGAGSVAASYFAENYQTKKNINQPIEITNPYTKDSLKEAKTLNELMFKMEEIQAYNKEVKQETYWDKKIREANEQQQILREKNAAKINDVKQKVLAWEDSPKLIKRTVGKAASFIFKHKKLVIGFSALEKILVCSFIIKKSKKKDE